jgi:site-specific recombinase XerD
METTELIRYRRALKRKNYSVHTVKTYMNILDHFMRWLTIPFSEVTRKEIGVYVDHLLGKRQRPKTITCHLQTIRLFFDYLMNEEGRKMINPVTRISLRLPKPLPRHLQDEQVPKLFTVITDPRDRAMFRVMLRCGLRVQEVAELTVDAVEYGRRQILVSNGKGAKDRVVYVSEDARSALLAYLAKRSSKAKGLFLVQKGPMKGTPLSVRGIQKRIEYYARKSGVNVSCHRLRHTMATQLLNADADLATIQDLLGHGQITTTQRYCRVANLKVQRDYYKAMKVVMQRTQARSGEDDEGERMDSPSREGGGAHRNKACMTGAGQTVCPIEKGSVGLCEVHSQAGSGSAWKDVMQRGPSQREEEPMGRVSILPMVSERGEVGDGEQRVERSSSRAQEEGDCMDSPCTVVTEGGMNGYKTWKG